MAHAHDLGDGCHWQTVAVGVLDGLIAFFAQTLGGLIQLAFVARIALGESRQALAGLGCFSWRSGD
jgi:hypothetical protein